MKKMNEGKVVDKDKERWITLWLGGVPCNYFYKQKETIVNREVFSFISLKKTRIRKIRATVLFISKGSRKKKYVNG